MQRLLPIAMCNFLPKDVCGPLIDLSNFFRELCSKVLRVETLHQLDMEIIETPNVLQYYGALYLFIYLMKL